MGGRGQWVRTVRVTEGIAGHTVGEEVRVQRGEAQRWLGARPQGWRGAGGTAGPWEGSEMGEAAGLWAGDGWIHPPHRRL